MIPLRDRVRQFREASTPPAPDDYAFARDILDNDGLYALFVQQEPRDIRHGALTARWLVERNETNQELLMAALLHDIGKGSQRRADRVAWVVADAIGAGRYVASPESQFRLRRAIARTANHAVAGANLLRGAGAPDGVIRLTLLHHDPPGADGMLRLLQAADAAS